MGKSDKNELIQHDMAVTEAEGIVLMDAVEAFEGDKRLIHLFFRSDADTLRVFPGKEQRVVETRTIGGAPWWIIETDKPDGPIKMVFADTQVKIDPSPRDQSLFAGKNCFVAVRSGETAQTVLDWLDYHTKHHDLQGVVILNRAKPGSDKGFMRKMRNGVKNLDKPCVVTVLSADTPLGAQDAPAESHPYCAPDAPGKDRMEIPASDPWASPLSQVLIYELIRNRYLATARAVANLDVYDLLVETDTGTAFDAALEAKSGVIPLAGSHCYPWRTRKNREAQFGDHICVQFDVRKYKQRWCIAPAKAPENAIWRLIRIGNVNANIADARHFYRFMALRHTAPSVSKIVPKSSLVEDEALIKLAKKRFNEKPVRMPTIKSDESGDGRGRAAIVTCMKNEGPFILEWIAYHRAIGFDDFLVYTNDCTDGTDTMLEKLQEKGIVQHRDNPFKKTKLKPQHAALAASEDEEIRQQANWLICMDVDEFINIKVGDGTLDALFAAVPDANMIAMTWRLFGNAEVHEYTNEFLLDNFTRCAPEYANKPHQAWGFKTLFQNIGLFKKMGVHRPKGLNPQLWEDINWVNGSGKPLPKENYRNAWRSTTATYGYDLVQLNHYAVRSAESFLVKRDRGRVNHVDRDQGLAYWFRMNNNAEEETSIQRMIPKMRVEFDKLMADPELAEIHHEAVRRHRAKIDELRATEKYTKFYSELTGPRMQKLAHLHSHFGANVFLTGPDCIPPEVIDQDPSEEFFFTIERGKTNH